jgi:YHS domain-containing protein
MVFPNIIREKIVMKYLKITNGLLSNLFNLIKHHETKMKKIQLIAALLLSIFIASPAFAQKEAVNTKGRADVAIKGFDPVSYWTDGKPTEGSKEFTTEWHGGTWRFSSQENLDLFKGEPEKYAPQYGGYCAWAMADGKGRAVGINPEAWTIYNDKLYLNYNKRVLKEWLTTKDADIEVANKNYPAITDVNTFE